MIFNEVFILFFSDKPKQVLLKGKSVTEQHYFIALLVLMLKNKTHVFLVKIL